MKAWVLTEDQIAEWSELYPGVDVDLTLRQALAWVLVDPRNRKTAKGMGRFLVGWLNRAVARGTQVKRSAASVVPWHCPHVEVCSHRSMCQSATLLGRPRKTEEALTRVDGRS